MDPTCSFPSDPPPLPSTPAAAVPDRDQQCENESAESALRNAKGDVSRGGRIKRKLRWKVGDKNVPGKSEALGRSGAECGGSERVEGTVWELEGAAGSVERAAIVESVLGEDKTAREVNFVVEARSRMSWGLGGEGKGVGDVHGESKAKDVTKRESRGRQYRRRGRLHIRRERRRERQGEMSGSGSDSEVSSDSRYHVSYGTVGAWGCVAM